LIDARSPPGGRWPGGRRGGGRGGLGGGGFGLVDIQLIPLPHHKPLPLLVVEAELLDLPLIKKQRAPRDEPKSALKTNGG
jgi:hypothetical protein